MKYAKLENGFVLWENKLGKVNIARVIFQGEFLSPLLFMVALIPVTIILRTLKQRYSFGRAKERLNICYSWMISCSMVVMTMRLTV